MLADKHRNVAILSGRDCSMQRRFQKIVEEGPPISVGPDTMRAMELAAAKLSLMVDYTHAGTVEYLFIEETGEFYFLELNPRLQVEHPVTEGITGMNIPSLQLMVAMGVDLTKIDGTMDTPMKAIAPYICDVVNPSTANPFAKTDGHVVAVRITAENAADGWKPTVGAIHQIDFQSLPGVWGYFSVRTPNAEVHAYADSQFGHVFAHAPTRKQAAYLLLQALKQLRVVGEIHSNVPYVRELIMTEDFLQNRIDTGWLDKLIQAQMQLPPPAARDVAVCGSLLKVHLAIQETTQKLLKDYIARNAAPPPEALQSLVEMKIDFIWANTKFTLEVFRHSKDLYTVAANGSLLQAKLVTTPTGSFVCSYAGASHKFHYDLEPGDRIRMTLDGQVVMLEKEKDPSILTAPYAGKLTRYLVDDGAHLGRGEPFAEVEVMKMLFLLNVSEAGTITLAKGSANVVVDAGEKLGSLELDDPSLVAKAAPFVKELGDYLPPLELRVGEGRYHRQLGFLRQRVHAILDGYVDNEEEVLARLQEMLVAPETLVHEWDELMAGVGSKLPQGAREKLAELVPDPTNDGPFGATVLRALSEAEASMEDGAVTAFKQQAEPIYEFATRFKHGLLDNATGVVREFLEHFIAVERFYPDDKSELLGVYNLNIAHEGSPEAALQGVLSHFQIERKVSVMLSILDLLGVYTHMDSSILNALKDLSSLMATKHLRVQRKAKQISANCQNNIVEQNKDLVLPSLRTMSSSSMSEEQEVALVESLLAELTLAETKVLSMLGDSEKLLRKAVAKAAVLLWYSRFNVRNLSVRTYLRKGKEKLVVSWSYTGADGSSKEGFLFVFSSLEDLESNFDDLCVLTLKEAATAAKPAEVAPAAATGLTRKSSMNRSYSFNKSAEDEIKTNVVLHVLVLGQTEDRSHVGPHGLARSNSLKATVRNSFRYAVLDEAQTARMYQRVLASKEAALRTSGVEKVSVHLLQLSERDNMNYISIFNFEGGAHFEENKLLRHILPTQAAWLELHRLTNFNVERCWFPDALLTHVYLATAKAQPLDKRLFVRTVVLRQPAKTEEQGIAALAQLAASELPTAFNTLEQAIGDSRYHRTETNHIFFRLLAPLCITTAKLEQAIGALLPQYASLIKQVQAYEVELVLPIWEPGKTNVPPRSTRVICRLAPSYDIKIFEEVDGGGSAPQLKSINNGEVSPLEPLAPYELLSIVDQKRLKCLKLATTYAYDFTHLFELAVSAAWESAPAKCGPPPTTKVNAVELVLTKDKRGVEPLETPRPAGTNKIGMLAWLMTLATPEYPNGREIVVISNDITFANGTFGPLEDDVFEKASQYARERGIPRIYLGANSGARFGLSDAVRKCFRIQWNDPYDLGRGIAYLWLTDKDCEALGPAVVTERVPVPAFPSYDDDEDEESEPEERLQFHNKIVSIIGLEEGLGVESLPGAGKIAAETSIANRAIFTLGYSTARNIGIGSDVLRPGQRVVQHNDAPILLTGFQALNKLLGTNVYESNLQLGGPEVMGGNGVAHILVDSDLEAIQGIVKWVGFVPCRVGAPLPCLPITDPIEREIGYYPPAGMPFDPRQLLCGDGNGLSGMLDEGSFVETLSGWAKTVITGRGRLGGMPVGVIVTENRAVESAVLADPANLESKPTKAMQAGQVWFPDSAYKTAQAIQDFNTGENLPLIVLANWRGFSGGRKDMFEEVLKFGSFIVDQLTQYNQPIIVYIPPHCEIRGGAWVVIDSTINPRCMEMYAAEHARGGVLEPAGIAEIKFRKPELVKAMHRMDKQLKWMSMNEASGMVRPEDVASRETELLPSYQPLGEIFCDLHDRYTPPSNNIKLPAHLSIHPLPSPLSLRSHDLVLAGRSACLPRASSATSSHGSRAAHTFTGASSDASKSCGSPMLWSQRARRPLTRWPSNLSRRRCPLAAPTRRRTNLSTSWGRTASSELRRGLGRAMDHNVERGDVLMGEGAGQRDGGGMKHGRCSQTCRVCACVRVSWSCAAVSVRAACAVNRAWHASSSSRVSAHNDQRAGSGRRRCRAHACCPLLGMEYKRAPRWSSARRVQSVMAAQDVL